MATEGVDVRISLQRLLIGLLLTIVPLSVAGLYITDRGDKALQQAIGSHFKIIADSKADQISQFVNDALMAVGAIAAYLMESGRGHEIDLPKGAKLELELERALYLLKE